MKKIIISILLGTIVFSASPQEILTLEKCKELALKNNAKVKNAKLSVEMAGQQKKEAFTKYFPSVSATGVGVAFDKSLMTTEVATGYPAPNDKAQVDMLQNALVGGFMATQPVFAGGQIINGNRLAKAGMEVSKLQNQMTENEVLLAAERYFWQLVLLKEKIVTIENAEALLNRLYNDVTIAVEAGLTVRNDMLRVELERNRLESGKSKALNGLNILKTAFAQHIGLENDTFDIETPLAAIPENNDEEILPPPAADLSDRLPARPEYRLLEKSVDIARLQRDMEIGKHLPTVALGAGYNWVKLDLNMQSAQKKNMGLIFATLSVPISDWWGGSYAVRRKKLEVQQAENTRQDNSALLLLQMKQINNELSEAYRQVQVTKKSISVANENLRMGEDNYKNGISILSDLLDAQSLLQQSRDQYAEAITEYFIKWAEYRQVMN
jgi:outer membrane protein TolC